MSWRMSFCFPVIMFLGSLVSSLRMLVLYVPLAWAGSRFFDVNGVFRAGFIVNFSTGIFSYKYLFKTVRKIQGVTG